MLTPAEKETVITTSNIEDEWTVYTTQPYMIKRMERIGIKPYKTERIDGIDIGAYYKVPFNQLKIVKKRKELDPETKKMLSERMKKLQEEKIK